MRSFFIITAILMGVGTSYAEGIKCYDSNNTVGVEAPKGWIADFDTAKKIGVCAFFYPEEFKFKNAPIVFYPNISDSGLKIANGKIDIEAFIKSDLESFKTKSLKLKIETLTPFTSDSGLKFIIKKIVNGPPPNEFEAIAYLPMNKAVFLGVFSSRSEKDFKKYESSIIKILNLVWKEKREDLFKTQSIQANKDLLSEVGKVYETKYTQSIGSDLANAMKKCSKLGDRGFNAVLQISENGRIQDWINEADEIENSGPCVKESIKDVVGTKPPFAPFHILIEMKIQD